MRKPSDISGRRRFLKLGGAFALTAPLAAILGGCAAKPSTIWENPSVAREDWPLDNSECRRAARRKIEQEFGGSELDRAPDNLPGAQTYDRSVTRYDANRRQTQLFEDCMRQRGYRPMKRNTGAPG